MALEVNKAELLAQILPEVESRARIALELWDEYPRKQDAAGYPFAKTENPRPDLDVEVTPDGFLLTIRGPQVEVFEHGNGPGRIRGRRGPLRIQLNDGGVVSFGSVNSYEGERAWLKSVEKAFLFF